MGLLSGVSHDNRINDDNEVVMMKTYTNKDKNEASCG